MRIAILTTLAMIAFAANSVLARLAFATAAAEPLSYTGIRLGSGAIVLAAIGLARTGRTSPVGGSWQAAGALFGYAFAFSVAYILLGAGTGALILFASVQIGMIGWAIFKGDRPDAFEWAGLLVALVAFAFLVSPGLVAPHPFGTLLMVVAGLCWAAYTLLGRRSQSPLIDTAGNFIRLLPVSTVLLLGALATTRIDPLAAGYAMLSGAIASGLGYAIWYAALPSLQRTTAAIVQLSVPAIAALGGVLLIGEALTPRLVIASIGILGGVAIALKGAERRRARAAV